MIWNSGPCHPTTLFFGTIAWSSYGPLQLHLCKACNRQMVRNQDGRWLGASVYKKAEPKIADQILLLTSIYPHTNKEVSHA